MTKVSLPDVTLVAIDCVAHDLTRLAIEDTLREIEPAEILVFSDRPIIGPDYIECQIDLKQNAGLILWHEVPQHVKTSHILTVQWDGWVLDGSLWESTWLDTDYIGAPWWYTDGFNVGNGGFSLRSVELTR